MNMQNLWQLWAILRSILSFPSYLGCLCARVLQAACFCNCQTSFRPRLYFVDISAVLSFFSLRKDPFAYAEGIYHFILRINERDSVSRSQLFTVYIILFVSILRMSVLLVFPPTDPWSILVFCHITALVHVDPIFTIFFICIFLYTIYLYYILFSVAYTLPFAKTIIGIVLYNQRNFLFGSDKDFLGKIGFIVNYGFPPLLFILGMYNVMLLVKFFNFLSFKVMSTFYLYYMFLSEFWQYPLATGSEIAGVVISLVMLGIYVVGLALLTFIGTVGGTVAYIVMSILFTRIRVAARVLYQKPSRRHGSIVLLLKTFLHRNKITMEALFDVDKLFSPAILTFMLFGCPMNAVIVIWIFLISDRILHPVVFGLATIALVELAGLVGLHFMAAYFSRLLHAPFRQVLHLFSRLGQCSLRTRLRISQAIMAFHTKKKYGFSYILPPRRSFGFISMLAFAKFSFVYFRFLIFSSKYFNRR